MLATACAVALALVGDTSGSISGRNYQIMWEGHAAAFESPQVLEVIGRGRGVAVAVTEFSDVGEVRLGWRVLRTREDSLGFAEALRGLQRRQSAQSAVAEGVHVALDLLANPPCEPDERVIDVVADGQPDYRTPGRSMASARERAMASDVKVNVLGIYGIRIFHEDDVPTEMLIPPNMEWLEANVMTPDTDTQSSGFIMKIESWDTFSDAIRVKIAREIASAD